MAIGFKLACPRMLARTGNASMPAGLQKGRGCDLSALLGAIGAPGGAVLTMPQFFCPENFPADGTRERFPSLRIVLLEAGPGTVHAVTLAGAGRDMLAANRTLFHFDLQFEKEAVKIKNKQRA